MTILTHAAHLDPAAMAPIPLAAEYAALTERLIFVATDMELAVVLQDHHRLTHLVVTVDESGHPHMASSMQPVRPQPVRSGPASTA